MLQALTDPVSRLRFGGFFALDLEFSVWFVLKGSSQVTQLKEGSHSVRLGILSTACR